MFDLCESCRAGDEGGIITKAGALLGLVLKIHMHSCAGVRPQ